MNTVKLTVIFSAVMMLVACGGGSSGGDSDPIPVAPTPSNPPPQEAPTTADLVVSSTFDLATYQVIEIDVDVSQRWSGKLYLNVCETNGGDTPLLNYKNCLLKAPLKDGKLSASFSVSYSVNQLGAEILDPQNLGMTEVTIWDAEEFSTVEVLHLF